MIERLEITGVHLKLWSKLEKYVYRKIGRLDRFIPRHAKKSVHGRVILSENRKTKSATCEVVLELPHATISAREETMNIFSSVDIVEVKLANQIRKYKTAHTQHNDRRLLRRLLGRAKRSK
ncbi:MAG: ribosome-associated translation inhibitor RaiA [Candidatus Saccharibacteria bacterium]|nr:ribosome-associated translation inhibitor RaiA [Candidatus Saccharibacteria bacterium]MCY4010703.1 ribosome-associated translation inhibitor RaiA [Candidatus Saccharibacteria bacterium]MCY4088516.1 ribosome-associated translation inhibitor RaiA [Candidatus Saccharibacteria bacterium]